MSWRDTLSIPMAKVVEITGLERRTLNQLIREKELESMQQGRIILIGTKSLVEYFEKNGIQAPK